MSVGEYVQVGVTAYRDPATGEFLPSVPLYARAEDVAVNAEDVLIGKIMEVFGPKIYEAIARQAAEQAAQRARASTPRPERISDEEYAAMMDERAEQAVSAAVNAVKRMAKRGGHL